MASSMQTLPGVFNILVVVLELLLFATCIMGDYVVDHTPKGRIIKAVSDSSCHGLVAMLSWGVIIIAQQGSARNQLECVFQVVLCGLLAVIIDVDHFWVARSLSLKEALSLPGPSRPPLHNSSLIPVITLAILMIELTLPNTLFNNKVSFGWIFCIAWTSHHIRDATRRGLWFAPFGSTFPIPYWGYISIILIIPVILRIALFSLLKTDVVLDKAINRETNLETL